MKIKDIISKKKNNMDLSYDEIRFAVENYLSHRITKLDMVEFLKTIHENGMNESETIALSQVMANSGEVLKFPNKNKIYADKHSTGGVSDSTTLIISPIIACSGIGFLKMSGGKLGHTGGTADKLESFEGYKTNISIEEAKKLISKNGAVLCTQTDELAPADKYIYNLRDENNIIESIPLIASSIMSKKIATGSDVIVLDVKCGNGAFMKTKKDAFALAELIVKIGINSGKKVSAIISDMNQPLGNYVGNLLETIEAIKVLKGKQGRLRDLSLFLSAKIIEISKKLSFVDSYKLAEKILDSRKALRKFKKMVKSQNGKLHLFKDKEIKQLLSNPKIIYAKKNGYVSSFNLEKLGNYVHEYCSAGNKGIKVLVELGQYVEKGTPIIELHGLKSELDFHSCLHFSKNKKTANKLIIDVI